MSYFSFQMGSTFAFFPSNPLTSIYNKPTNNDFFTFTKSKTPTSGLKFSSMKTEAKSNNITGSKNQNHLIPKFDFEDYMELKIKHVKKSLDQTIPMKHPSGITEAMRYSLLGNGKFCRPVMCLASCELVGGDEARAMPVACAVEMINAASLILDDLPCMDDDDVRRGKAATHKAFGEGTAILAASSVLCLAFQHVAEMTKNNVPKEHVVRSIVELGLGSGFDGVAGGELMDLNFKGKLEANIEEVERIHMMKSSRLFEAAVVCGAIMGGGSEEEIERLRRYGTQFGLLYQVVNDILDVTKPSQRLGKTAKKDLVNDTTTYPKIMGLTRAKEYVEELRVKTSQELSCFDEIRASPLNYMMKYVVNQLN